MASKNFNIQSKNQYISGYVSIVESNKSVDNNTSLVTVTAYLHRTNTYSGEPTQIYNVKFDRRIYIDGEYITNDSKATLTIPNGGSYVEIYTASKTVVHNSDGNKTVSVSFQCSSSDGKTGFVVPETWDSLELDYIPRQATLTDAPNFNDESNPTIYYSNPAGNSVSSLQACISLNGSTDDISYRDISKTGSSYTFNLTDSERNILKNSITSGNSRNVKFYVRTTIGTNTYYSILDKNFSLVNYTPIGTISSAKDTNTSTLALTGSENSVIQGYSNVAWSVSAYGRKNASIRSYSVKMGSATSTSTSGTFNTVNSNVLTFIATDSRGYNTGEITKTFTNVTYVKPSVNLSVKIATNGTATLTISGNCQKTFPAKQNAVTIQYRYKEENQSYSNWTNVSSYSIDNDNTYILDQTISGLAYTKKYIFQAKIYDYLSSSESVEVVTRSYPVFDWSEEDFNFNVPVSFNGKSMVDLIYPVGAIYISVNNANPSTLFGGEWEQLKDRFLIGAGGSYSGGSTSGSTTHTHSYSHTHSVPGSYHSHGLGSGYAQINHHDGSFWFTEKSASYTITGKATASGYNASTSQSEGIALGGSTDGTTPSSVTTSSQSDSTTGSASNMPPYLAVYMWKRIS